MQVTAQHFVQHFFYKQVLDFLSPIQNFLPYDTSGRQNYLPLVYSRLPAGGACDETWEQHVLLHGPGGPGQSSASTVRWWGTSATYLHSMSKKRNYWLLPGLRIRINFIRIRIQHFRLNTDPDPIRIQGLNDQKLKKTNTAEKKFLFFLSKTAIYISLGLHKVCPSYSRSLQLSKEAIQHFKTWTFTIFFYFCGSFLPSWIRIRIHWPNLIRIRNPDYYRSRPAELESTESGTIG